MGLGQPTSGFISDIYLALKAIFNVLSRPIWHSVPTNALRVMVVGASGTADNLGAVTTVASVTSVVSVTGLNSQNAQYTLLYPVERTNWSNSVRRNIS